MDNKLYIAKRCCNSTVIGFCEISEEHMNLPIDDDGICQCLFSSQQCSLYSPSRMNNYDTIFTRISIK